MLNSIKLALKGAAMGVAEVIPGVSGGTIAFITGIYERLIESIKSVDAQFLKYLGTGKLKRAWSHVDGPFLLTLVSGMAIGIVAGVFGVSNLMENHPEELWGFFFGLILASALYIGNQVGGWNASKILYFALGAALAYGITIISPVEGSSNPLYVFMCGVIAISALILPGVSGSFMLLLLGIYTVVIGTVKHFITTLDVSDLVIIGSFAAGCVVGLATFSRVLSWLFRNYHNETLALLTGVMIGSLNKIWPWRLPNKWMLEDGTITTTEPSAEEVKVLAEENVLPAEYTLADPNTAVVVTCMIIGFLIVFLFDRFLGENPEQNP